MNNNPGRGGRQIPSGKICEFASESRLGTSSGVSIAKAAISSGLILVTSESDFLELSANTERASRLPLRERVCERRRSRASTGAGLPSSKDFIETNPSPGSRSLSRAVKLELPLEATARSVVELSQF